MAQDQADASLSVAGFAGRRGLGWPTLTSPSSQRAMKVVPRCFAPGTGRCTPPDGSASSGRATWAAVA